MAKITLTAKRQATLPKALCEELGVGPGDKLELERRSVRGEVVWARYAGQMLVVTPFAWQRAGAGFWRTRHPALQLLRSAFLLAATICFFGALRYLPLAEGSAITFLAPIFVIVLSGPLLGERPEAARWFASIAGFIGILILVRPGSSIFHPATLLLVVAALCNALYFLMTRKLADESVYTTLFYSALVGTVALSLALPWQFDVATPTLPDNAEQRSPSQRMPDSRWLTNFSGIRSSAASSSVVKRGQFCE